MSEALIRAALEARLATVAPAIDTVLENGAFTLATPGTQSGTGYKPINGTPYQKTNLMRAQPGNPESGTFHQSQGFLQVTLEYPPNIGPGAAEAQAALVAAKFARALSLTSGGVTVTIMKTPYIMSGFVDGDRWAVPVRIYYQANI